jgi:hypothetical protein
MAVSIELHNTGDPSIGAEVRAQVEHALSGRAGDWRVSIVGSHEKESWEMKVWGANGFERSYTLVGSAGEHQPSVIANVLVRLRRGRRGRGEGEVNASRDHPSDNSDTSLPFAACDHARQVE